MKGQICVCVYNDCEVISVLTQQQMMEQDSGHTQINAPINMCVHVGECVIRRECTPFSRSLSFYQYSLSVRLCTCFSPSFSPYPSPCKQICGDSLTLQRRSALTPLSIRTESRLFMHQVVLSTCRILSGRRRSETSKPLSVCACN